MCKLSPSPLLTRNLLTCFTKAVRLGFDYLFWGSGGAVGIMDQESSWCPTWDVGPWTIRFTFASGSSTTNECFNMWEWNGKIWEHQAEEGSKGEISEIIRPSSKTNLASNSSSSTYLAVWPWASFLCAKWGQQHHRVLKRFKRMYSYLARWFPLLLSASSFPFISNIPLYSLNQ